MWKRERSNELKKNLSDQKATVERKKKVEQEEEKSK